MITRLCESEHLAIIILVLLVALLVVGSGKGIGTILGGLIRKITGKGDVVVNVGETTDEFTERRRAPALTVESLKVILSELHQNQKNCLMHEGVISNVDFVINECKSIWLEIKEVNQRQRDLRAKLPEQYVVKSDLSQIQERLRSIDAKLDRYMEISIRK